MAKRGGFPGGMPGNMNNLMLQTKHCAKWRRFLSSPCPRLQAAWEWAEAFRSNGLLQ